MGQKFQTMYKLWGQTTAPEEQTAVILSTSQYIVYQSIWVLGPTIYFANAVIDVKWALIVRNRDARRRHLKKLLLDIPSIIDNDDNDDDDNGVDTINGTGKKKKKKRSTTRSRLKAAAIILRPKVLLNRMRRHIGHRRQLSAATTFGMGAFLGILAAVCNILVADSSLGENEDVGSTLSYWSSLLESASIHMYLVSAISNLFHAMQISLVSETKTKLSCTQLYDFVIVWSSQY
jgi:hypothetical protein